MRSTITLASVSDKNAARPPIKAKMPFRTVAIYPNFIDAVNATTLLKQEGFTDDQISLLGREQDDWQERLGAQWKTMHAAKGAVEGAALGAIPGLVLVAGVALTGGIGLLAAGPMVVALSALGLGALGGSVMGGGAANDLDRKNKETNIELEVEEAIGLGQWVVIAHSHDETEAFNAQTLLPQSRIVLETEPGTNKPN